MKPFCEHPVVLLNPAVRYYISRLGSVYIHGNIQYTCGDLCAVQDLRKFLPKKNNINADNYGDGNYIVDRETGCCISLYICVPCGKCRICRARKANELAARCVAETNKYGRTPLFVTFTYSDEYLPKDGVQKADLQLFFKRLRSRLDYYKVEHNIRYLAVAEYGSKTARPHYHAIIWNFPECSLFPTIKQVIDFISRCWSRYRLDRDGKRIPRFDAAGHKLRFPSGSVIYETDPIGWIKVLPVKEGCPAYVTKYMKKGSNSPAGKNPCFQLASRRGGGIGSDFIKSQRSWFMSNPNALTLDVCDKVVSGRIIHMPITPYVKNLLLGTPSTKIESKHYALIKEFVNDYELFKIASNRILQTDYTYDPIINRVNGKVVYNSLVDEKGIKRLDEALKRVDYMNIPMYKNFGNWFTFLNRSQIYDYFYELKDRLQYLTDKILEIPDYNSFFATVKQFKEARQVALSLRFKDSSERNVENYVEQLERNNKRNEWRETF